MSSLVYSTDCMNEVKKRRYSIAYVVCLVLFFSNIPYSLVFKNEYLIFILSLLSEVIAIIVFFIMVKKEDIKHKYLTKFSKKDLLFLPFFIMCFSNYFVVLFNNFYMFDNRNYTYIILETILCLFNVIIEELLFRYLIQYEFERSTNKFKALVYSSLIFGCIHILNISSIAVIPTVLVQVIYTFGIGLIFGLVYMKSNHNIIYPIIFHFVFNFINNIYVTTLFPIVWDLSFFIINICVGIITALYAIYIFKFKKESDLSAS